MASGADPASAAAALPNGTCLGSRFPSGSWSFPGASNQRSCPVSPRVTRPACASGRRRWGPHPGAQLLGGPSGRLPAPGSGRATYPLKAQTSQGRAGQRIERRAAAPALVALQSVGAAIAHDALDGAVRAALVPTSGGLQQFNRLAGRCLRRQPVDEFRALRSGQSPDQRPYALHVPLLHPPPRRRTAAPAPSASNSSASGGAAYAGRPPARANVRPGRT